MNKILMTAAAACVAFAGAAQATTLTQADALSGSALVNIYQSLNNTGNADDSADATLANAEAATFVGSAIYTGDFWFSTNDGSDSTTISTWLTSAGGTFANLTSFDDALTISDPDIGNGSATTTWFVFEAVGLAQQFNVDHDDGLQIIDDKTTTIYSSPQPQTANGFSSDINWDGGFIQFAYAATNGDPSVFKIAGEGSVSVVPLPAGGLLLLTGFGALALRRRKQAAKAA